MLKVQKIKECNCEFCRPNYKYAALIALTLGGFWIYRMFKKEK